MITVEPDHHPDTEIDPDKLRRLPPIPASKAGTSNFYSNDFTVFVPDELEVVDFENHPELWSHVCSKWKVFDTVRIVQSRRYTVAVVSDQATGFASLRVLHSADLAPRNPTAGFGVPHGYSIRRGLPSDLSPFAVIRDRDNLLMNPNDRCNTEEEARKWLLSLAIWR